MSVDARQARWTIFSFALGAFAIGVSEFAAMGLLPYYASGLGVSEPVAGHAVSAYAIGVVIGAPILAIFGARLPRKPFLLCLILAFGLANILGALAPSITTLVISRFLAGLPHGAYLGITMLFAAELLPRERRASGVAQVMLGLTLANVIGVPAAGAIGQEFGWRSMFIIVSVIAAISAVLIARVTPNAPGDRSASPLAELRVLKSGSVWLTLLVGAIGFGGIFAVYAYLSAAMIEAASAPAWSIPLALCAFGVGATLSNIVAARLTRWSQFGAVLVLLCGMTIVPILYTTSIGNWQLMVAVTFCLGTTAGVFVPLQVRLMDVASKGQTLAAAMNHAAFNFANALGPFLAGLALSAGFGWASTGWVGAGLAASGLVVLALAYVDARQRNAAAVTPSHYAKQN